MQSQKCKVLLVDDHVRIRDALRSVLAQFDDIEIVGDAGDGRQAIERVDASQPDVILMDINMPKMNGIEATSAIMKFRKDTLIIGMCVVPDPYIMNAFLKAGAVAVISKDRLDHLHSTIQQACANRTTLSA